MIYFRVEIKIRDEAGMMQIHVFCYITYMPLTKTKQITCYTSIKIKYSNIQQFTEMISYEI
jgi:hypothetical protein